MADIPRLNGVIKQLEAGKHAITCFQPAEVNVALEISQSKYDGVVYEMEHNYWDGAKLARCAAVLAQPPADPGERHARAAGDADGAHPRQRRGEEPVDRQAGPRHGLLRHHVPAHLDRGPGLQRHLRRRAIRA